MSVKNRILISLLSVTISGLLSAAILAFVSLSAAGEKDNIIMAALKSLAAAEMVNTNLADAEVALGDVLAMTRLRAADDAVATLRAFDTRIGLEFDILEQAALSDDMRVHIADIRAAKAAWLADALTLLGEGDAYQVPTLEQLQRNRETMFALSQLIEATAHSDAIAMTAAQSTKLHNAIYVVVGVACMLILTALAFAMAVAARIAKATQQQAARLRRMAGQDDASTVKESNELKLMANAVDGLEAELDSFKTSMGEVVARAAKGDLSARVSEAATQDELRRIARLFNQQLETVEQATSEVSNMLEAFSDGNLSARMRGDFEGVFARLQDHGNETGRILAKLVGQIRDTTETMQSELDGIRNAATGLTDRTTQQVEQLQAAAHTLADLIEHVDANAKSADLANRLSQQTSTEAMKGADVADEAVAAMQLVSEQTNKISTVTDTVDDIAFQTQLLSLNAAVEAARVGELGKGFAVVAHEVRSLAEQAGVASTDIGNLVTDGARSVSSGVGFVEATGKSLIGIRDAVQDVVLAVSDISEASQNQSQGASDVSAAVKELMKTTESNAAMARDSARAVESLSRQADGLKALIAFFDADAVDQNQMRAVA